MLRVAHGGLAFGDACGAVLNAMWDIWAKVEEKPMWKLLVDLSPEFVVEECIDWRNIQDALSKEEALEILNKAEKLRKKTRVFTPAYD